MRHIGSVAKGIDNKVGTVANHLTQRGIVVPIHRMKSSLFDHKIVGQVAGISSDKIDGPTGAQKTPCNGSA